MMKVWIVAVGMALVFALNGGLAEAAEAAKGKKVFNKCKICHSLKKGKKMLGPSLHGFIGRTAGTVKGFRYSKAMKKSGVVWDDKTLDTFLTKPEKFVPGTKMKFRGLKKKTDRDNLIAYLKEAAK